MNESNSDKKTENTNVEAQAHDSDLKQINVELSHCIEASIEFMGKLPPPMVLQQYNTIHPNTSDRIISMVEREQEHKHKMREKLIDTQILDMKQKSNERQLEQIFGFSIGVISIISGSIIAICKSPLAGSFISSTGLICLAFIFLFVHKKQQKNNYQSELPNTNSADKI
ncbi:DUF2335 domain-containing protein [Anabaena subtropica]|uniref:DUF2335 domain-containing protein n=1 Tax=Anabaena subtropica FACHB-260 TaxID=2692884 RepID=A0ABR8CVR0_9NOST|nr:DUF2335 domain-containing protein [Anabaena subtropica]MBD2346317.1 DUF2335 domain-containing protein [Anabaena subtropica FACHB-260]